MSNLSVIVPFFNAQNEIGDLLESLSDEDRRNHQFIFVNDASTDCSNSIVLDAIDQFADATLIDNAINKGVSYCRNLGLEHSTSAYLTFLDADDWVTKSYLSAAVGQIDHLGVDFVKFDHIVVEGKQRDLRICPESRRQRSLDPQDRVYMGDQSTMIDYPQPWTGIYRTSFIKSFGIIFDEELHTAEDRLWTWHLHLDARSYAVSSIAGYFYRKATANSLTKIGDKRQMHFLDAIRKIIHLIDNKSDIVTSKYDALVKCARTLAALIAFHHEKIHRLDDISAAYFHSRARSLLDDFDRDILTVALRDFGESRLLALAHYR